MNKHLYPLSESNGTPLAATPELLEALNRLLLAAHRFDDACTCENPALGELWDAQNQARDALLAAGYTEQGADTPQTKPN